ncbi:stage V sporulation protein S [Dehalobacterium formicoaceticum]|uniref:Stage V sporulation protein S n=1 Tax=Dehalobacterium formicoaceticum TaxID=51515 RepID=A0ABT1Y018_9FIRM|nr:stage V sporulation protein S [Dehalobacterium formicoaceticum]MCR6544202.1 stage V sporulation protein S [Dehalobacterium formicoaceticum]
MEVLRVAGDSDVKAVAGALVAVFKSRGRVEVQAVGAGAVNQAIKAIAISRGFVAPNGIDLVFIPAFSEVEINDEKKTAIKFFVQKR